MTELWTFSLCKRTIKASKPDVKLPRGHNDCLEILANGSGLTALQFYNDVNPIDYLQNNNIYVNILSQNEYKNCIDQINHKKVHGKMAIKPLPGKPKNDIDFDVVFVENTNVNEVVDLTNDVTIDKKDNADIVHLLKTIQNQLSTLLAKLS
jgi:hypothetical protein